jgi:Flp pilus assembly protein TadD
MTGVFVGYRVLLLGFFLAAFAAWGGAWAQESSQRSSATAEAHLGKGYDALKQDQYEVAASEFREALSLDPQLSERARFPLAVALFEMHKSADARHELESLRATLGNHPNLLYYLGRLDLDTNDFKGAVENLTKAASKPPFPDTAYYLGFAYLKEHDLPNAEKWLKAAQELIPRDSRVEFQLARVYREQGRADEATKTLAHSEQLRRRDEDRVRWRQECAQKLEQGVSEDARAVCEQLYDPEDAEALTSLGTIYGQHRDLNDALRCFQRAAELAPQSPQMQYNLALTYYNLNQFERARMPLEQALKRWSDLFQLNALYGAVLAKLGEDTQAYHALRKAHELNPQDSGTEDILFLTMLQLAKKGQEAKDYSSALHYLQEAAAMRPQEPEPHRRMAEIYARTDRAAQAKAEQQAADRLNKSSIN